MQGKFAIRAVVFVVVLMHAAWALPASRQAVAEAQTRGVTLRVGAGCTFASIQAAIDSVAEDGSAVLRIRDALFEENLVVTNRNIELIGGHDSCSDNTPAA